MKSNKELGLRKFNKPALIFTALFVHFYSLSIETLYYCQIGINSIQLSCVNKQVTSQNHQYHRHYGKPHCHRLVCLSFFSVPRITPPAQYKAPTHKKTPYQCVVCTLSLIKYSSINISLWPIFVSALDEILHLLPSPGNYGAHIERAQVLLE